MPTKIQLRRDNYLNSGSLVLSSGEPFVFNGNTFQIGDGTTLQPDLPFFAPISHYSVLPSNSSFGTVQTETIFGGALNLLPSTVYEIEYQLVGSFVSASTNLTISIENFISTGTQSFGRYISEWTVHKDVSASPYDNLSAQGTVDTLSTSPTAKDARSDWTDSQKIHPIGSGTATGTYYFMYKVKGVVALGTLAGTLNPRLNFSNTSHITSLTVTAGSYIKATLLGNVNTTTRFGDWT